MAVLTVECVGSQWQSDFSPLVPHLYTYFSKCFWGERDYEELRQRAVLYTMHRSMRQWCPGHTVRIATCFIVWHARAGRCGIIHRPNRHHTSVRARTNVSHKAIARWRAKEDRSASRLHFKEAIGQLTEKEQSIVWMWLARYTWAEICSALETTEYHIAKALRHACAELSR